MTIIQAVLGAAAAAGAVTVGEFESVIYDSGFTTGTHSTTFTTITDGVTPMQVTLKPNRLYYVTFHLRVARDGASATHRMRLLASANPDQANAHAWVTAPLADTTDPLASQTVRSTVFQLTDLDASPSQMRQLQTSGANPAASTKFEGAAFYKTGANQVVVSLQHAIVTGSGVMGIRAGTRLLAKEIVLP
jgi:hypothetical protein